jgi:hypothetical protein
MTVIAAAWGQPSLLADSLPLFLPAKGFWFDSYRQSPAASRERQGLFGDELGIDAVTWCECMKGFGKYFKRNAGSRQALANEATRRGQVCFHTRGSPLVGVT